MKNRLSQGGILRFAINRSRGRPLLQSLPVTQDRPFEPRRLSIIPTDPRTGADLSNPVAFNHSRHPTRRDSPFEPRRLQSFPPTRAPGQTFRTPSPSIIPADPRTGADLLNPVAFNHSHRLVGGNAFRPPAPQRWWTKQFLRSAGRPEIRENFRLAQASHALKRREADFNARLAVSAVPGIRRLLAAAQLLVAPAAANRVLNAQDDDQKRHQGEQAQ